MFALGSVDISLCYCEGMSLSKMLDGFRSGDTDRQSIEVRAKSHGDKASDPGG